MSKWTLKLAVLLVIPAATSVAFAAESLSTGEGQAAQGGLSRAANWLALGSELASPDTTEPESATEPSSLAAEEKPWEFKFKVYAWIPNYHGSAGAAGDTTTVDVSCNDVFHALDDIDCMVPINLEARLGRWGMIVDLFYVRLTDSQSRGPLTGNVESTQTILELAGFYRVGTWPVCPDRRSFLTLDLLGGARYNRVSGSIGLQAPRHAVSIGGAREWWDPFVGPRITWQATDKLSLSFRGDVGGFGIENCSHFTWQVIGAAEYNITRHCFLELGYRLLDTDYERGSGSSRFVYDLTMAGPYMAFGARF